MADTQLLTAGQLLTVALLAAVLLGATMSLSWHVYINAAFFAPNVQTQGTLYRGASRLPLKVVIPSMRHSQPQHRQQHSALNFQRPKMQGWSTTDNLSSSLLAICGLSSVGALLLLPMRRRLGQLQANKEDYDNAQAWQYFLGNYQRPGKPKWMGGKQWAGCLPQKPDKVAPIYRSPNQDYDPPPRMPQWIDPDDTRTPEQRVIDKWDASKWLPIFTEYEIVLDTLRDSVTYSAVGRMRKEEVERVAKGLPAQKVPPGYPVRTLPARFSPTEGARWEDALKKGVVEIDMTKLSAGGPRAFSQLDSLFRQYCDSQVRPYISLQLGPLVPYGDIVEIDASPLRLKAPALYEAFFRVCDAIAGTLGCSRVQELQNTAGTWKAKCSDHEGMEQLAIVRIPPMAMRYVCPKRSVARRLSRQFALFWNGELAKGQLVGFRYDV